MGGTLSVKVDFKDHIVLFWSTIEQDEEDQNSLMIKENYKLVHYQAAWLDKLPKVLMTGDHITFDELVSAKMR